MIADNNLTADGQTDTIRHPGGKGMLFAAGTWGSGTLKLQWSLDEVTWVDVADASLTDDGIAAFDLGPCAVRASLSESSNPDLNTRLASYPFGL